MLATTPDPQEEAAAVKAALGTLEAELNRLLRIAAPRNPDCALDS